MDDRKEICDEIQMDEQAVQQRMDALRKRLLQAVKVERRINYKELSAVIGQNATYVQQFVTKRSPRKLHQDQFDAIIAKLNEIDDRPAAPPTVSASPDVTARLLHLVARLILAPTTIQGQAADFIEDRLSQSKSRATDTKQEV